MLEPEDGYLTQYQAQVTALQERIGSFQNHEFLSDKVHTVYSLQGGEKDYISNSKMQSLWESRISRF